jgi:hypothetical protein
VHVWVSAEFPGEIVYFQLGEHRGLDGHAIQVIDGSHLELGEGRIDTSWRNEPLPDEPRTPNCNLSGEILAVFIDPAPIRSRLAGFSLMVRADQQASGGS